MGATVQFFNIFVVLFRAGAVRVDNFFLAPCTVNFLFVVLESLKGTNGLARANLSEYHNNNEKMFFIKNTNYIFCVLLTETEIIKQYALFNHQISHIIYK